MSEEHVEAKPKKRPSWIYAAVGIPVVLMTAGVLWFFAPDIQQAFTPGPTPLPGAVAEGGILYQTTFEEDAVDSWTIVNDGTLQTFISDGQLIVDVNSFGDRSGFSDLNLLFDDFVLQVDTSKVAGPDDNGIFVVFRLQDVNNYNRFDISSDGFYALTTSRDGILETVSEFHVEPSIQAEGINTIRIIAVGNEFQFFVNENPVSLCVNPDPTVFPLWENALDPASACLGGDIVTTWVNEDFANGRIGLGAQGFAGFDGEQETAALATIAFDNLIISEP